MAVSEQVSEVISLCAEDTGIDLVLTENGINTIIVFDDTKRVIRVTPKGEVEQLLEDDIEKLYTGAELLVSRQVQEDKLSILGMLLYKWDIKGYPVSPLLVTRIWDKFNVDFRAYQVDYDLDITESVIKYLVYKLIESSIDRRLPMKNILSLMDYVVKDFLEYDLADSCLYAHGAITELKEAKVSNDFLYL